jgi:serine/threonine-protein kinase
VVLKESVFPQDEQVLSKAEELFKREAEILSKLQHPNIAAVHDYFIENGRHYLSMEYIEGTDLNRIVLREGAQSPEKVQNWAVQLAGILEYLHGLSPPVVHRDISPENILLRADGSLALIDFGAAKEIASNFTGTIIGKQSYIAPEQFRGKPSAKSDVYALGATLYYLLCAEQPQSLAVSLPAEKRQGVPDELNDLVRRCTQLDERERPDAETIIDFFGVGHESEDRA